MGIKNAEELFKKYKILVISKLNHLFFLNLNVRYQPMRKKNSYITGYEKRFRIKRNNFWLGFFSFFGLGENPYFNILKEISTRTESQALQDDVTQLRNDCIKVIHDHHLEIKPKINW